MKDIIKIVAYIKVFGMNIYGTMYTNLDCGKGNLESYFCSKKGWSPSKLERNVTALKRADILTKATAEPGMKFYRLSLLTKQQFNLIEI